MLLLDHDVIKVNHASTKDKMDLIYTVLINHKTIYQSLMTSSPVQAKQIHSEIEKSIVEWTLAKEMPIPNKDLTYKAVESRIRYIANV